MSQNPFKPALSSSDLGRRRSVSTTALSSRIYSGLYSEYYEVNRRQVYDDFTGAVRSAGKKLSKRFFGFEKNETGTENSEKKHFFLNVWLAIKAIVFLYFPILTWLPKYNVRWFQRDIISGVTVAILLIPQSLAYAGIAGLKPEYGLYTSVVPLFVYAATSTSTQISPGITASMAILLASATEQIVPKGTKHKSLEFTEASLTLTFVTGIVFIILSVLKIGGIAQLLSAPVMSGYIFSSALIILLSQMPGLWKLPKPASDYFYEQLKEVLVELPNIHGWTALISILCTTALLLPRWFPRRFPRWFPMPLIVMILMTLISLLVDLKSYGVDLVEKLDSRLPPRHVPRERYLKSSEVWLQALVLALVLYADNISLARAFGAKAEERYRLAVERYAEIQLDNEPASSKPHDSSSEQKREHSHSKSKSHDKKKSPQLEGLEGSLLGHESDASEEMQLNAPEKATPQLEADGKDNENKAAEQGQNDGQETKKLKSKKKRKDKEKDKERAIEMESTPNESKFRSTKASHSSPEVATKKMRAKPKPPPPLPEVEVNPNVELMAYGLATLLGSFSSSIVCAASFSRTSLNFSMRPYTQFGVIVQALICLICLVAIGSMLAYLPKCVLASVVVSSVVSLITSGIAEGYFLWHIRRKELIEFLIIVIAPLLFGLSIGIALGVLASVMLQFWNNSQAEVVHLGGIQLPDERDIPGSEMKYVDVRRFPHAQLIKDVPVVEMRAEMSFVNYRRLLDVIEAKIHEGTKCIVVSMAHTYRLDTTALRQLTSFLKENSEVYIAFAQCRGPVRDILTRLQNRGLFIPKNVNQFVTIHDAVLFCQSWLTKGPRTGVEFLPPICDENDELVDEAINLVSTVEIENAGQDAVTVQQNVAQENKEDLSNSPPQKENL